jgi:hypothetical protein
MGLGLVFGWGYSLGFSTLGFSPFFFSNLILLGAHKLHWFLEIICWVRKYGRIWGCVKFFCSGLGLGAYAFFVYYFWWSLDVTNLLSSLTTTLSNLLRTKNLPIIAPVASIIILS